MTGMPRNFRPVIGSRYTGPSLDRPALRRLPPGTVLEESKRAPAWWRFLPDPMPCIKWLVIAILVYATCDALGAFRARAETTDMRIAGKAVAEAVKSAEKPQFPKAAPSYPVWSTRPCPSRTYLASSSDGRAWKTRCTGRLVRS